MFLRSYSWGTWIPGAIPMSRGFVCCFPPLSCAPRRHTTPNWTWTKETPAYAVMWLCPIQNHQFLAVFVTQILTQSVSGLSRTYHFTQNPYICGIGHCYRPSSYTWGIGHRYWLGLVRMRDWTSLLAMFRTHDRYGLRCWGDQIRRIRIGHG